MIDSPPTPVADGEVHALDRRSIALRRVTGWILAAGVAAGSLVGLIIVLLVADDIPGWIRRLLPFIWLAVPILMGWLAHRWPVRQYQHTSYRVDQQGIEIRRGVFWRVAINVPRSRVQHTDVSQGPLERRYGLGTLVIHTAGTEHARVALGGLEHRVALRIRGHLQPSGAADAV